MPGARLYKTGDLARCLPDGNLEFLGRIDHQIKIRGFRIELGEIETALLDLPSIKEAAVTVWENQPGDQRLIAYLVVNGRQTPSVGELRSFLKERLPDDMAPAAFVFLDALPLTPNGKVDRKALPAPDGARPEMEAALAAPHTPSEDILARIWAQVLRLDRIGVNDNFFELGGDSILSIQIVARANRAGLRLTPRQIFQHQTIAELASVAGTATTIRPSHFPAAKLDQAQLDSLVDKFRRLKRGSYKISAEEIGDVYPLSPTQRAMLLYNLCYPAGSGVYHQEFCYTLRGNLDVSLFERSWQQMVERHSILRTAFLTEPVQVVKRHVSLPLDYRDWRGLTSVEQQDQLEEFLKVDRRRRFEISEPPLMAAGALPPVPKSLSIHLDLPPCAIGWLVQVSPVEGNLGLLRSVESRPAAGLAAGAALPGLHCVAATAAAKTLRGGGVLAGVAQGFYDADSSWCGCRFEIK